MIYLQLCSLDFLPLCGMERKIISLVRNTKINLIQKREKMQISRHFCIGKYFTMQKWFNPAKYNLEIILCTMWKNILLHGVQWRFSKEKFLQFGQFSTLYPTMWDSIFISNYLSKFARRKIKICLETHSEAIKRPFDEKTSNSKSQDTVL